MKQGHRTGGKYVSNHTTVIPAAGELADIADRQSEVTKVSPGFIKAGLPSLAGKLRAKVTERLGNLLLTVRDNSSMQEVTVYTSDPAKTKRTLYREGKEFGIEVSFVKSS